MSNYEITSEYKIVTYQLANFDLFRSDLDLANSVVIRIHFNMNINININNVLDIHKDKSFMLDKNTKSRLVLYVNVGHMIHWFQTGKIIDAIVEIF